MAHRQNCAFVAVKATSSFMYKPVDYWHVPESGNLYDEQVHNKAYGRRVFHVGVAMEPNQGEAAIVDVGSKW